MDVAFDAYWWQHGPTSNRMVMQNTVTTWLRLFPEDECTLFVKRGATPSLGSETLDRIRVVELSSRPHGLAITVEATLHRAARRADVFLTHNYAPYTRNVAVFIHDMLHQSNPEWFTPAERAYFRPQVSAARRARLVFTSSRNESRRIEQVTGVNSVIPVGLGLNPLLISSAPVEIPRLHPNQFILTVGRLNVRKNIGGLIRSLQVENLISADFPLAVVGTPSGAADYFDYSTSGVSWFANLSDGELRWMYENCAAFVLPSRGEGFGLPAIEALYFGAPTALSDLAVFREVARDHLGHLEWFDPNDVDSIGKSIRLLLSEERSVHTERRAAVSPVWSWEATVNAMRSAITNNH